MRISGVHTRLVFDQVTAEQHFFFFHPSNRVTTCVTCAGVPDIHTDTTQIQTDSALSAGLAITKHQGWPGQAGHAVRTPEQTWEPVHFTLHVFGTALDDQIVSAFAGNDLGRTFSHIRTGTEHAHRVVVGEQHVLNRFVTDFANACNQVLRHQGCGGGVTHQNAFVANDDP